jgi:hypothetical protein
MSSTSERRLPVPGVSLSWRGGSVLAGEERTARLTWGRSRSSATVRATDAARPVIPASWVRSVPARATAALSCTTVRPSSWERSTSRRTYAHRRLTVPSSVLVSGRSVAVAALKLASRIRVSVLAPCPADGVPGAFFLVGASFVPDRVIRRRPIRVNYAERTSRVALQLRLGPNRPHGMTAVHPPRA